MRPCRNRRSTAIRVHLMPGRSQSGSLRTTLLRAAIRDAIEGMGRTVFAHGVMNWTKEDHWGYTMETGVMLKVVDGQFAVER